MGAGVEEIQVTGPAVALLELDGTPAGFVALDALAKEAPVTIVAAGTVQCGHFLIAFAGEVEPVEMSFERATRVASYGMIDAVLLPHAESRILPAMQRAERRFPCPGDSLGVVQTSTSPTLLRAIDAALKGALVDLVELRVAEGLGGRGLATLWGEQHDVQAALDLATEAFGRGKREGCTTSLIANADYEVSRALGTGTRFFKEFRG
jgi:microcompartment protein CcmL/EutN